MHPRLVALLDLDPASARENAGLHDYDGRIADLSPAGLSAGVANLGGDPLPDPYDDRLVTIAEDAWRVSLEQHDHRRNPMAHIANLDLSCYEREYAPVDERLEARRRHLAAWPDAVAMALDALDRVPAPVAAALLPAVKGLAADVDPSEEAALAAHARLVAHMEHAAAEGDPDPALGAAELARLMGVGEGMMVDLGRLAARADGERDRLRALLDDACGRLRPGTEPSVLLEELLRDHPTDAEEIYAEARTQIDEATAFTYERDLLPELGGECRVGPAPPARRWAMAMMSWAAAYEPDAPSWYHVTPPDPSWPQDDQEEWLAVFSRTTLPAITVHEVTPGHYAHGRMMRKVESDARRIVMSYAFVEGWAHYAEELFVEEGFRSDDPRYTIGVCVEALIRVTRLACALGLHSRSMSLDDAVARFEDDAFLKGPAARAEATRGMYDPTYGRYTWGKLEILALRDEARARWGNRYTHRRFHEALLGLGAPPLGLMGAAIGGD